MTDTKRDSAVPSPVVAREPWETPRMTASAIGENTRADDYNAPAPDDGAAS